MAVMLLLSMKLDWRILKRDFLLLPPGNVHACHKKPQTERSFPNEGGQLDVRNQMNCEPRCQKDCKAVGQVAESSDRQQYPYCSRKEGRPEYQVGRRQEITCIGCLWPLESKASCKTPNSEVETFCNTLLVLSQNSRHIELVSTHSHSYALSWLSFYPLFLHLCYTVEA